MSDQPDATDDEAGEGGPRHESDGTSSSDAGLTGGEGLGDAATPAIAHDGGGDDDDGAGDDGGDSD